MSKIIWHEIKGNQGKLRIGDKEFNVTISCERGEKTEWAVIHYWDEEESFHDIESEYEYCMGISGKDIKVWQDPVNCADPEVILSGPVYRVYTGKGKFVFVPLK